MKIDVDPEVMFCQIMEPWSYNLALKQIVLRTKAMSLGDVGQCDEQGGFMNCGWVGWEASKMYTHTHTHTHTHK